MRVPGRQTPCLAPAQYLALSVVNGVRPVGFDDEALWCAEQVVTVRKDGVAFNGEQWYHPALLPLVVAAKGLPRATFVVRYNAAELASGTLTQVTLYQKYPTGNYERIAVLGRRDVVTQQLDITLFDAARTAEAKEIEARRTAAQETYTGLLVGQEAVDELRARRAARADRAAKQKAPPRVASPISAEKQARARRQAEAEEVYRMDLTSIPTAGSRRPRRKADQALDGLLAADVQPFAATSPRPSTETVDPDAPIQRPRSSRRSR